jgi:hypothetical protein
MNINELLEKLQEETFVEELNGEVILMGNCMGNCIVWSYDLNNDSEEIEVPVEGEEEDFGFDATSPQELLYGAYEEDLAAIEELIAGLEDYTDWTFSEPELGETTISFKIF